MKQTKGAAAIRSARTPRATARKMDTKPAATGQRSCKRNTILVLHSPGHDLRVPVETELWEKVEAHVASVPGLTVDAFIETALVNYIRKERRVA